MSKAATSGPTPQLRGERARQAILSAATDRFLRNGYRRTSIEDISRAAGVSRPTVYAHFESKQEIFRTIVADLHVEAIAAMEERFAGEGTIAERLLDGLDARFGRFVALTSSSPAARELLEEGSRMSADITADARERTLEVLTGHLAAAAERGELELGRSGLSADAAAAVICNACEGSKGDGTIGAPAYRRRVRQVLAAVLDGLASRRAS